MTKINWNFKDGCFGRLFNDKEQTDRFIISLALSGARNISVTHYDT